MLLIVFINHESRSARIPRALILRAAKRAQKLFGNRVRGKSVGVVYVSPTESKKLNTTYRGKRKATNVLSFESSQPGELGDILICPTVARAQAHKAGIGFSDYVVHLFAHGLLHLLGYAHHSKKTERDMDVQARKILNTK